MKHIILLHGATGSKDQMQPVAAVLGKKHIVHTLNFSGHGGESIPAEPFSIKMFTDDVLQYIKEQQLQQPAVFGYSMGGYAGMFLACHYPEMISSLVTLATKFHWDEPTAAKETKMLQPAIMEKKVPALAQQLQQRHTPQNWKMVLEKTADMLWDMGKDNPLKITDYTTIKTPVLIMLGDRDKMVSLDETLAVYKRLPNARFCMLPATPHPLEQADASLVSYMIQHFLEQVSP